MSGFQDANGKHVQPGDRVEHGNRFTGQFIERGKLLEALQDGDAHIETDDGRLVWTKWVNLCKIEAPKETEVVE